MTDGDPQIDCVLQVIKGGVHQTVMFTCTEREYRFLAWLAERMPESLKLTKVGAAEGS